MLFEIKKINAHQMLENESQASEQALTDLMKATLEGIIILDGKKIIDHNNMANIF